jgi:hypothetical protein
MGILGVLNLKALAGIVPVIAEIAHIVRGNSKDDNAISELQARLEQIEQKQADIYKAFTLIVIVLGVLFLLSVAGLVIGIVLLSRGY